MGNITTEAWVLYAGNNPSKPEPAELKPAELKKESFSFADITEFEVLAEPIYGCWEGNMTHALQRRPVDICKQRKENPVVLGNAGVVRILKTGRSVTTVQPGDLCVIFCNGVWDKFGYPEKILAYDAPNTMGCLAKQMKLHEKQVILLPENTDFSLKQWAAFSLRYITAWANWKLAYGCWRVQMTEEDCPAPFVWGWGGGVSIAELSLAQFQGARVAMIASDDKRLKLMESMRIKPIDRRKFPDLEYDEDKYQTDPVYKKKYTESEEIFLDIVKKHTLGLGVSIFIDYVGSPVTRATLRALARQGVVTTAGWKEGMKITTVRAIECIQRHIHIHTHYARYPQGRSAVRFAEDTGWLPKIDGEVYSWDNIPQLAHDYANGKISNYYPLFEINRP
ncbi:MAG: zinc-binding dehydrogenase [Deltaproteobacteria bacterium]|nr:zinc-binding dehydrogenase [Deltaproteobacteria bacterium]